VTPRLCTLAFVLIACAPEDDEIELFCADAPIVTWESFGKGFITETCQPCHASTSTDRNDAPMEVQFDTHEDVLSFASRILERATGSAPTMPPSGGVDPDERYLTEVWLTCYPE